MYQYDDFDQKLVEERATQFRSQLKAYQSGEIDEDAFRVLRLMNGVYIQRHAPMMRIAIPYGTLNGNQLAKLAEITRKYDQGYAHFTTRTNIQLNWLTLESVPDILLDLATVQMHAIQTSGNCIRTITTDPMAGVNSEEVDDPRFWCELIRQWSTLHPEFAYLPRKFKIAVTASPQDRAVSQVHDVGLHLVSNQQGNVGFEVLVGGGLGRTPKLGKVLCEFVSPEDLLPYLESILHVYNLHGRRDNMYKARIKILVEALGVEAFKEEVDKVFSLRKSTFNDKVLSDEIKRINQSFLRPNYRDVTEADKSKVTQLCSENKAFDKWYRRNVKPHKVEGYTVVMISLKQPKTAPGDVSAEQLDTLAELAREYSHDELRSTQRQNVLLPHVHLGDLEALWKKLDLADLAYPNIDTLTDSIACPGMDYCSLANAHSIPIAKQVNEVFEDIDYVYDLGDIHLNISGCINACAHHHIADIGILGVDKKGEDYYQIVLGGQGRGQSLSLGKVLGKAVSANDVVDALKRMLHAYLEHRHADETFNEAVKRLGTSPFKEAVYETA